MTDECRLFRVDDRGAFIQGIKPALNEMSEDDREKTLEGLRMTRAIWVATLDRDLLFFVGIIQKHLLSNDCYIWMYTTEHFPKCKVPFIRHARLFIRRLLDDYDLITGHSLIGDKRAIKLMTWLGAVFHDSDDGETLPFEIRKT